MPGRLLGWMRWCLLFCGLSLWSSWAFAASAPSPYQLTPERVVPGNLSPLLYFLADEQYKDADAALAAPLQAWNPPQQQVFNAGYTQTGYWLRVHLEVAEHLHEQDWVLVVHNAALSQLQLYRADGKGLRKLFDNQAHAPLNQVRAHSRHWLIPVEIEPGSRLELLLYAKTTGSVQVPVSLLPYVTYLEVENRAAAWLACSLGALAALAAIALLVGWMLRDGGLLYYSLSMGCILMTHVFLQGLWTDWIGTLPRGVQEHILFWLLAFTELAVILFTREQMSAPGNYRHYPWLLTRLAWLTILSPLLTMLFLPFDLQRQLAMAQVIPIVCILLWIGVHNSLRCQRAAIYYTVAMGVFFAGSIMIALSRMGLLPVNRYTENVQLAGSVFSAMIFLMSVNERVKLQRRSKLRSKQQALEFEQMARETQARLLESERQTSEALEQQVRARTRDLESALAALQSAKLTVEQADRQKSRFLAAASHDIRQPLHALSLLVEDLPTGAATAPTAADVDLPYTSQHIRSAVGHLVQLFEQLFDLSKLYNQQLDTHLQLINLNELLVEFAQSLRPLCEQAGVELRVEPADRPVSVYSDRVLLLRVLSILSDNALKHAHPQRLILAIRAEGERCWLSVTDDGRGIPIHEQQSIFEEFYQLENPERDRRKGMGLGLALCRRLVDVLGGGLQVQSVPGAGATFQVDLALADQSTAPQPDPVISGEPLMLQGLRLLLVDDDTVAREPLERLLRRWGADCRVASGIQESLLLIARDWQPELAILDYRLPGGDNGLRLADELRAHLQVKLPVVILTADLDVKLQDPSLPVLYKPLKPSRLRAVIQGLLQAAAA